MTMSLSETNFLVVRKKERNKNERKRVSCDGVPSGGNAVKKVSAGNLTKLRQHMTQH